MIEILESIDYQAMSLGVFKPIESCTQRQIESETLL